MENSKDDIHNQEIKKNFFQKLKSIHDYFINKEIKTNNNADIDLKKDNNIYIKYLENPNIIFQNKGDNNNNNLKLILDELNKDMDNNNNVIFPFLDICKNLIKAYIESDLDDINEEKNNLNEFEFKYLKTIEKIKNNCFISKEIIYLIYDYFSDIYDIIIKYKEINNFIIFKKLNKMIKLLEIFYEKNIKKKNISSFCFIGGTLSISFNNDINLSQESQITITINILNDNYIYFLNDKLNLVKINDDKEIKYEDLKNKIDNEEELINKKLIKIIINININAILIEFRFEKNEFNFKIENKININQINNILLLEEFYGQISSLELSITKNNDKIEYQFLPISIRDENCVFHIKKIIEKDYKNELNNIIPKLILNDKNFANINYINYNDKEFDIIDYFGGIIQFLPFYQILKNLTRTEEKTEINNNENITKIPNINYRTIYKDKFNDFLNFIIKIILNKLFSTKSKEKKFKKYICFIYYLLLDLNLVLSIDSNAYKNQKNSENIIKHLDFLVTIYYYQKENFKCL